MGDDNSPVTSKIVLRLFMEHAAFVMFQQEAECGIRDSSLPGTSERNECHLSKFFNAEKRALPPLQVSPSLLSENVKTILF